MNEASLWRRALAERIALVYASNPEVAAILLSGSVARGWADHYSDIELGIYWSRPPTKHVTISKACISDGVSQL